MVFKIFKKSLLDHKYLYDLQITNKFELNFLGNDGDINS